MHRAVRARPRPPVRAPRSGRDARNSWDREWAEAQNAHRARSAGRPQASPSRLGGAATAVSPHDRDGVDDQSSESRPRTDAGPERAGAPRATVAPAALLRRQRRGSAPCAPPPPERSSRGDDAPATACAVEHEIPPSRPSCADLQEGHPRGRATAHASPPSYERARMLTVVPCGPASTDVSARVRQDRARRRRVFGGRC